MGAAAEDAVYTVDGIYEYTSDGQTREARLYFRNGVLEHVFGFTGSDATGGAREIIPQSGDQFHLYEKWLDLYSSGQVSKSAYQPGTVLTFSDQPFRWEEVYAPAGDYVVGFIVEDLDGNQQQVYSTVTVR